MNDIDYHLLSWLEQGHSVFRPAERTEKSRQDFQALAERIAGLRGRGFIHYLDNHISKTESGEYLLIGPCTLLAEGRAALKRDRDLGSRPPRSHDRPWLLD